MYKCISTNNIRNGILTGTGTQILRRLSNRPQYVIGHRASNGGRANTCRLPGRWHGHLLYIDISFYKDALLTHS